jgi:hypothetical protein
MALVADRRIASQGIDDAIHVPILADHVQLLIDNIGVTIGALESKRRYM